MGTVRNPAQLREMWTSWNDNVGAPMRPQYARMTEIANAGRARARLRRHRRDVALQIRHDARSEFAALTERLWNEVKPLYDELHCFTRAGLNRRYGDAASSPPPARSAPTCSAICGRRNGAISTTSSRRAGRGRRAYDLTQLLDRANYTPERIDPHRRGLLQLAGLRAAAGRPSGSAR